MVRCEKITDIGTYCKLLEYGDLEALVPITEVTKQRVRLVSHIIPVGRVFVAIVLSVDPEKGYIDLSKKRVNEEDILNCETRYFKSRKLHSVLVQLDSGGVGGGISNLYERVWKLSSPLNAVAGKVPSPLSHPVDHLETFLNSLADDGDTSKGIVSKIREKYLASKISEIQAEVEMTCFSPEGIEGIKKSIREGLLVDPGVKIRILSAPLYLIQFSTREPEQGIRVVEKVIDILGRTLRSVDGELCIKKPPSTTDKETREQLQYRLAVFERQQEELDGDEDSE